MYGNFHIRRVADFVVHARTVRAETFRFVQLGGRFICSPHGREHDPEVQVRVWVLVVEPNGSFQRLDRFGEPSECVIRHAEPLLRAGVVGIEPKGLPERIERLRHTAVVSRSCCQRRRTIPVSDAGRTRLCQA
jgi:hypothetical protein